MNTTEIMEDDQAVDFLIELLRRIDSLVVEIHKISSKILWDEASREIAAEFILGEGFRQISELRSNLFGYLTGRIGEDRLLDLFE